MRSPRSAEPSRDLLADTAALLATGDTTAEALVSAALACHTAGAVERRLDRARQEAGDSDERRRLGRPRGPYDGIPFAVKANLDVAGVPTTAGTAVPRPAAVADAAAVGALRALGMVPVVTATLAEAALGAVTDNPHTGRCVNPRYPALQAGGSSGGSAALVAAGCVPAALGSDTMGSVRIPAAYCGIAAWKPSRGIVDTAGLVPLSARLDSVGVLAQTSADLVALATAAWRLPSYRREVLRIGIPTLVETCDAGGQRAVHHAATALTNAGHKLIGSVELGFDPARVRRRGLLFCEVDGHRVHREAMETAGSGLSPAVRRLFAYGAAATPERIRRAEAALNETRDDVLAAFTGVDILLLPVTPAEVPAYPDDPPDAADLTAWVNVSGLPAVAFPSTRDTAAGRPPRGLQLVGGPGADALVLTVAAEVERALRR